MKFHEQVLLDIINDSNSFFVSIGEEFGGVVNDGDEDSVNLTFMEAVRYCEDELPYYRRRFSHAQDLDACICDDSGECIAVYNGRRWSIQKR